MWISDDINIDLTDILSKVLVLALTKEERVEFYISYNTTKGSWYNTTYYSLTKHIDGFYLGNMDIDQTEPKIVFGFEVCLTDDTTAVEMMDRILEKLKTVLVDLDHSEKDDWYDELLLFFW